MYNAKLVKDAMLNTLQAIRLAIGIEEDTNLVPKQRKADTKEDAPAKMQATAKSKTMALQPPSPSVSSGEEDEEEESGGSEEIPLSSESESSDVEWKGVSDDDVFDSDAYAVFDARIASSSSENEENELSTGEESGAITRGLNPQRKRELLASFAKGLRKTPTTDSPNSSPDTARTDIANMEEEIFSEDQSMDSAGLAGIAQLDGTSDVSSRKRPAKTAAVARRMILSHLGLKKSRTLGTETAELSTQETSAEVKSPALFASDDPAFPSRKSKLLTEATVFKAVDTDPLIIENFDTDPDENISSANTDDAEATPLYKRIKTTTRSSPTGVDRSHEDIEIIKRNGLPTTRLARSARRAALRESIQIQEGDASSESDAAIPIPALKDGKSRASKEDTKRLQKEDKAALKAQKSAKSTFLPSLADGAYWSGSDSAPSDIEDHVAPRKNRRGQRARQAIAEKKHGKAAKHLSAESKKNGRDDGWDLKRGATSRDDGWRKGKGSTWKGTDANGISGSNAVPVTIVPRKERKRAKDDEGPLHPSWEAKKNAKTKNSIVPFKGKRITFD
jgi:hypothetical protein